MLPLLKLCFDSTDIQKIVHDLFFTARRHGFRNLLIMIGWFHLFVMLNLFQYLFCAT